MSEQYHPGQHGPDDELEAMLRKLEPSTLDPDLVARLEREGESMAASKAYDPTRMHWRRVIPLTLACCLVMAGYAYFQYGPGRQSEPTVAKMTPVPAESIQSTATGFDRFEPVSAQGYLVNTSSGGVVQTDQGPQEKVELEYQDAYHWRDPKTGTNIRFFQPRKEELIVPLRTD